MSGKNHLSCKSRNRKPRSFDSSGVLLCSEVPPEGDDEDDKQEDDKSSDKLPLPVGVAVEHTMHLHDASIAQASREAVQVAGNVNTVLTDAPAGLRVEVHEVQLFLREGGHIILAVKLDNKDGAHKGR